VLVAQRAHEPAAGAGDLRRVEREALVLRDAEVDRAQLGEPDRGAVLAAAAADPVEALGLVAHADLLELDARAEHRREVAHELAEVDALLGREVEGDLLAVPLPLGVGELHDEAVGAHALHRAAVARRRCRRPSRSRGACPRQSRAGAPLDDLTRRGAVRDAGVPLGREGAGGVHAPEVLPAVGVDDDPGADRRQVVALPEEELLAVAGEGDFDEVGHGDGVIARSG
jgi:hypothetical protein